MRPRPDGLTHRLPLRREPHTAERSSGRKTKNGRFMCYIIMKRPIDIIKLIKLLPLDFMSQTAEDLKADYKVKKLQALRLFSILLIAFIRQSEISQRKVCEQISSFWLDEFLNITMGSCTVTHSSLSERLASINPDYFARVYQKILSITEKHIGLDQLLDSGIIRIDTTLVAETSAKLSDGINTGVNNRFGGQKRQLKYGMAYDGFAAVLAKVFDQQQASSEEVALGKTILETASDIAREGDDLVFDRGVAGYDTLCGLKELCRKKHCHFISRLKLRRIYHPCQDNMIAGVTVKDDEFEIIEDCIATLNRPANSEYGVEKFRIIKVRFIKTRPKTLPSAKRRRYEPEMLLITDDFDSDPLTLVHKYKKRWDIEVFYKFLKQNLSFSHFLTTNRNGIQVVLYMTLITAVLIKLYAALNDIGPTIAQTRMVIQLENWIYTHPLVHHHRNTPKPKNSPDKHKT